MSYNKAIFHEEQKQHGAVVWISLAGLSAVSFSLLLIYYNQLEGLQKKFSINQLMLIGGLITTLFVGLYFLFQNLRMETKIDNKGIYFRYPPFKNKYKLFAFNDIQSYKVIEYNPLKDYGGWGYSLPAHYNRKQLKALANKRVQNRAYSIKGKIGLHITLKSQQIILLGTQRREALEYALKKHFTA
jgi:hypothetical protein